MALIEPGKFWLDNGRPLDPLAARWKSSCGTIRC